MLFGLSFLLLKKHFTHLGMLPSHTDVLLHVYVLAFLWSKICDSYVVFTITYSTKSAARAPDFRWLLVFRMVGGRWWEFTSSLLIIGMLQDHQSRSHIEIKWLHLCLRSGLATRFLRLLYHRFPPHTFCPFRSLASLTAAFVPSTGWPFSALLPEESINKTSAGVYSQLTFPSNNYDWNRNAFGRGVSEDNL